MAAKLRWLESGVLWRQATKVRFLQSVGPDVWVEIVRVRRWSQLTPTTQGWKDVYIKSGTSPTPSPSPSPTPTPTPSITLNVTATPTSVSGTRVGAGNVMTNVVDINVTKGTGPYTFTFSRVSYSGSNIPGISIVPGDTSKAQFTRNMSGAVPETQTARFKCVVKDSKLNKGTVYIDAAFYTVAQAGTGGSGTVNDGPPYTLPRPPNGGGYP